MVEACSLLFRDVLAPASSVSVESSFAKHGAFLLISQLDRPLLVSIVALQLLQHTACGRCARLRIVHEADWPELRLESAAAAPGVSPLVSTLPMLCGSGSSRLLDAAALLDYRCHVPPDSSAAGSAPSLPGALEACLSELATFGNTSRKVVGPATGEVGSMGDVFSLLGASSASARAAVASRAVTLLQRGMEEAVREAVMMQRAAGRANVEAVEPPRCAPFACGSEHQPPGAVEAGVDASPSHPLPLGPACEVQGRTAAPPRLPADVAAAAAAHVADGAGLLPAAFDRRFKKCSALTITL